MAKIMAFGEGKRDIGGKAEWDVLPALQQFVKKIINKYEPRAENFTWFSENIPHIHELPRKKLKASRGFDTKVRNAIIKARYEGCDGAVFVVDYAKSGGEGRLKEMKKGREDALRKGEFIRIALGVAIMEFEAWILADGKVRRNHLGPMAGEALGKIEEIENPKDLFGRFYGEYFKDTGDRKPPSRSEIISFMAGDSNIDLIVKECPNGFEPFMKEVKENLLPIFKENQ